MVPAPQAYYFFFFNDTATTEIYTLSLHDALPIWNLSRETILVAAGNKPLFTDFCLARLPSAETVNMSATKHLFARTRPSTDRKSTRLNSSHSQISYAVFCLKKKESQSPWSPSWPH